MPSQQPVPEIEGLEDPLLRAYAWAWDRILQQQQELQLDPATWRKQARLREMERSVSDMMDSLDAQTAEFVRKPLRAIYGMGVAAGSAEVGGPASMVWSQIHANAVQAVAQRTFDNLLKSTKLVRKTTKQLIRKVAKDEILQKLIEGNTAVGAGKRMEKLLAESGIHAVRYRDGSTHGLAEYSQMAVRTETATAYNLGTLNGAEAQGVQYWEVFDGICGWSSHDDSSCNGRIVTKDEALSQPISHPQCRRAFGGRPDVTSKKQAIKETAKGGGTSPEQRVAQAAADSRRLAAQQRRQLQNSRVARREARKTQAGPSPLSPSGVSQGERGASRQARKELQDAKRGQLDVLPPSAATEDMILKDFLSDPYAKIPSVQQLITQGFTPEDAQKEFKRLKANAASKASKMKAKMQKAGNTLVKEDKKKVVTGKDNPGILHQDKAAYGESGYVSTYQAKWWSPIVKDTVNYIPVQDIRVQGYKLSNGIVTRRNGRSYLLETPKGAVVTQAMKDELEANIKLATRALADVPPEFAQYQKATAFLKGNNPHDAHWAKTYKISNLKSAATGGDGSTTFWNVKPTVGTTLHEFGHNLDRGVAAKNYDLGTLFGSKTKSWKAALKTDEKHSAHHIGMSEDFVGGHAITVGAKGVSGYGASADVEDFAESVRLYLRDRHNGTIGKSDVGIKLRFVDLFPARAAHLDEIFGNVSNRKTTDWYLRQKLQSQVQFKAVLLKASTDAEGGLLIPKFIDEMVVKLGIDKADLSEQTYHDFGAWVVKGGAKQNLKAKVEKSIADAKGSAPIDYAAHGVPQDVANALEGVALNDDPWDMFEETVAFWYGLDSFVLHDFAGELGQFLENEFVNGEPKIWDGIAKALTKEIPKAPGVPEFKQAKKDLPANVKASIASKKSVFKKKLLGEGMDIHEAEVAAVKLEQEEVFKRWRALFGDGGKTARVSARTDFIPGEVSPHFDAALNSAGARWLKREGTGLGIGTAAEAKNELVNNITKKLDSKEDWEIFREYKNKVRAEAIAKNSVGYTPNAEIKAFGDVSAADRQKAMYDEVNARVAGWAGSSGDSNPASIMMQLAVKDEFGVTGDPFVSFSGGSYLSKQDIHNRYAIAGDFYRRVARGMYDHTQEEFRTAGITHVSLYRGMGFESRPSWATVGKESRADLMPINSWSTSRTQAVRFANGAAGNGGGAHKIVLQGTVPVELIIGTARTGFGCLNELEMVVLDASGKYAIVPTGTGAGW